MSTSTNIPAALVIGIGNEFRGDDAVGRLVARRLTAGPGVRIAEENGEAIDLITAWKGAHTVILIDAINSGSAPGTIHRFDATSAELPAKLFHGSSHAFSVAEAIELARVLGELPSKLVLYGIEARNFDAGSPLSTAVAQAIDLIVTRITHEIDQLGGTQCMSFH